MLIAVADCGVGNLRSVVKALEHVAPRARVALSRDAAAMRRADRLVLPGQGAIGAWMAALSDEFRNALLGCLSRVPVLGICLGLQAMFESSEEDGGTSGLRFLRGKVRRFGPGSSGLKVPHMGWNNVAQSQHHPIWAGITDGDRFYFVHSYYARGDDPQECFGMTRYGVEFTAAAGRDNLFAVQFHPEKSQRAGLRLIENFVAWGGGH